MLEVAMLRMRDKAAVWLDSLDPDVGWPEFEQLFLDRFIEPIEEAMSILMHCRQGYQEKIQAYTDRFKSDARAAGRAEDLALRHQYLDNMRADLQLKIYRHGLGRFTDINAMVNYLRSWEVVSEPAQDNRDQSRQTHPYQGTDRNRGRFNGPRTFDNSCCQGGANSNPVPPRNFTSAPMRGPNGNWTGYKPNTNNGGEWRPRPGFNGNNNHSNVNGPPVHQSANHGPSAPARAMAGNQGADSSALEEVTRQLAQLKLHMEGRNATDQSGGYPSYNVFDGVYGSGKAQSSEVVCNTWEEPEELCNYLINLAVELKTQEDYRYVPSPKRINAQSGSILKEYSAPSCAAMLPSSGEEVQLMDYQSDEEYELTDGYAF
jgi:hypothetical protein